MLPVNGGIEQVLARAGARAADALNSGALARLVGEVDGLRPGNGIDDAFDDVLDLLGGGRVVDVLGRPGGAPGTYASVVQAEDGARMLAVLRDGARRDLGAERFFVDLARAADLDDLVTPTVVAGDGSAGLMQLVPDPDLRTLGVATTEQLDARMRAGLLADGLAPDAAARAARLDRELGAVLDAATAHVDRHPGNALLDTASGRLTLIDNELVGGGLWYREFTRDLPWLDPLLPGGRPMAPIRVDGDTVVPHRIDLNEDTVRHLREVDLDAVHRAHERLARTPISRTGDEIAEWIRSPEYRADVLGTLGRITDEGGWTYVPVNAP
jgi:hypothetical protein